MLGEYQPRVSELLNRKIDNTSVDKLLYYRGRLGIEPKVTFPQTRKEAVEAELKIAKDSDRDRASLAPPLVAPSFTCVPWPWYSGSVT